MSVPVDYVKNFFGICHGKYYNKFEQFKDFWDRSDFCIWKVADVSGDFTWQGWDEKITAMKNNKVNPLILLDVNYTPIWVSKNGKDHYPPRSIIQVKDYVEKVVNRYCAPPFEIKYYELSNEPNIEKFWNTIDKEDIYVEYIEKILIPAAEIIHNYGGEVVAPSITLEWPCGSWSKGDDSAKAFNLEWNKKAIEIWLETKDAWKYIDYFSIHYAKGDSEKLAVDHADNLMPIFDYIYNNWVQSGKIKGIWNTEEGLTAKKDNISLEPWECKPYSQWIPRYIIPFLYWALSKNWEIQDQYKLFWYDFNCKGVLKLTGLANANYKLTSRGKALCVLSGLFDKTKEVGICKKDVKTGFGLFPRENITFDNCSTFSYQFTNYSFTLDDNLLIVSWIDLPGIETEGPPIQGMINDFWEKSPTKVISVDYLTGEEQDLIFWKDEDTIYFEIPRTGNKVLYLKIIK